MFNVRTTSVFGAIAKMPSPLLVVLHVNISTLNMVVIQIQLNVFLVSDILVAEASAEHAEEEEEELQELVFRIRETEESKLFRKFLDTWDNHFNKQRAPAPLVMQNTARKKKAKVK